MNVLFYAGLIKCCPSEPTPQAFTMSQLLLSGIGEIGALRQVVASRAAQAPPGRVHDRRHGRKSRSRAQRDPRAPDPHPQNRTRGKTPNHAIPEVVLPTNALRQALAPGIRHPDPGERHRVGPRHPNRAHQRRHCLVPHHLGHILRGSNKKIQQRIPEEQGRSAPRCTDQRAGPTKEVGRGGGGGGGGGGEGGA